MADHAVWFHAMSRAGGISLIQLLAALGTVAVLSGAAIPLCRTLLLESRMTSAVNALVHGIHAARQIAHREAREVVLCRSAATPQCAAAGDWSSGWIIFINRDADDPPRVDPGETLVMTRQEAGSVSVSSNRRAYVLRPYYLRATNGTVVFCDERGPAGARAVIVSYSGRPRVSRHTANGGPLACPA